MRYLYIALIVLITAGIVIFKFQNVGTVTVSFLAASLTVPLSLLVIGVYFLGMCTGGLVISSIRALLQAARKPAGEAGCRP